MESCEITIRSLKEFIEWWWTEQQLEAIEDTPDYISEILSKLDAKGCIFNLSTGEWVTESTLSFYPPEELFGDEDEDDDFPLDPLNENYD